MAGAELLAALLRWAAWLREGLAVVRRRLFRARVADDPVGVLLGQLGGKGGASSPADPVDITFRILGNIIVDNEVHIVNIQAAGSYVSSNQDIQGTIPEFFHDPVPLVLA